MTAYVYLKDVYTQVRTEGLVRLLTEGLSRKEKLRLSVLMERSVRLWNNLPRNVVEAPLLGTFKSRWGSAQVIVLL